MAEKVVLSMIVKFKQAARYLRQIPKATVLSAIALYRATRFLRTPKCRFYPSCSEYTAGSVKSLGALKGVLLGMVRVSKCHPWHEGGIDFAPSQFHYADLMPGFARVRIQQFRNSVMR